MTIDPRGKVSPAREGSSTVLFLAANPDRVPALRLGEECREIEEKIRGARYRDSIRFRSRWAARPDDLLQALNEDTPSILHFSGHGSGEPGLYFQADDGTAHVVSTDALVQVVRAAGTGILVVILNACYSKAQAEALRTIVPCVIGISGAIDDRAAITYAASFYRALAFGNSVGNAHEQGLAALAQPSADGTPYKIDASRDIDTPADLELGAPLPQSWTRSGIDANHLYVVRSADTAGARHWRILIILATSLVIGVAGTWSVATWRHGSGDTQLSIASDAAMEDIVSADSSAADALAPAHDTVGSEPNGSRSRPSRFRPVLRPDGAETPASLREANRLVVNVKSATCSSIRVDVSTMEGEDGNLAAVVCNCTGREIRKPLVVSRGPTGGLVLDDSTRGRLLDAARSLTCDGGGR